MSNYQLFKQKISEAFARELVLVNVSEGDTVSWFYGLKKRVVTGKVGEQKEGARRLHVILDKKYADKGESLDKYVSFSAVYAETVF